MSDADQPTPYERAGITWWNELNEAARRDWMRRAGDTGRVADAWAVYKQVSELTIYARAPHPVFLASRAAPRR